MSTEGNYIQQSFSGGLNQEIDSTRLSRDQYPLLINGRSRYDTVTNIRLPLQINDGAIAGNNYQNITAADHKLIIFVDGKPFCKDLDFPNSGFMPLSIPPLDANVPLIFTELVPNSYSNFNRKVDSNVSQKNTDVELTSIINQTPQTIVCQDGINQPIGIFTTNAGRQLKKYAEWTLADREYVPVGNQMLYHEGILYIVSKDKRRIYRSITGRGLDFMVVIQPGDAGDKFPLEDEGGAETVSHAVDFNEITSLNKLTTEDGAFFVSTKKSSYAVVPLVQPEDLILGEPTFGNRFLFSAGCVSPYAFIELLGDFAFQDFNGLRSFNAVLQLKNEGSNSPFSKRIGPILQGISQDYVAAINFDNYALFACNTIYGRGIVVYDTLSRTFVAVDIYPGISQIKQFAEVKNSAGERFLFFITTDNKLYQAFAGDISTTKLLVGEWCSNDPKLEQRWSQLKLVFIDCKTEGNVNVKTFVDRKLNLDLNSTLFQRTNNQNNTIPIEPPYGTSLVDNVQILSYDIARAKQGWKAGFMISWDMEATLSHIGLITSVESNINSVTTQAQQYVRNLSLLNNS